MLNYKNSATRTGISESTKRGHNDQTLAILGHTLPNVNKHKDYFTSCLPSPQKGDDVIVKILNLDDIEVKTKDGQLFTIDQFDYQEEQDWPIDVSATHGDGSLAVGALEIFTSETDKRYDDRTGTHGHLSQAVPQG